MRHSLLLSSVVALDALLVATPGAAQAGHDGELRAIIAAQARQIEVLSARIDALEGHGSTVSAAAGPADGPGSSAMNMPASPTAAPATEQASAATAEQSRKPAPVLADWHTGGVTFSSPDGRFTFHPRGRVLADVSTTSGSRYRDRNIAGTEFRNVRLGGEGNVGDFAYRIETDFAGNAVALRDAFIGWETGFAGRDVAAYLGNRLNDRSLDGATSITSIPFVERNVVGNLIVPQVGIYGLGLFVGLSGDNGHVSFNVKGEDAGSNDGQRDDSVIYLARAHINPVRAEAGFVHLGVWGFHETLNSSVDRLVDGDVEGSDFNQALEVGPGLILDPTSDRAFGVEGGGVFRSVWALGEYGKRQIRARAAPDATYKAWSVSGGWYLTGETPPLSTSSGTWGRPHVRRSLVDGGIGAIQLLARYDRSDLSDAPGGGRGRFLTIGGTWFLTDWADIKLNWVRFRIDNPAGDFAGRDSGSTLVLRGEVSF